MKKYYGLRGTKLSIAIVAVAGLDFLSVASQHLCAVAKLTTLNQGSLAMTKVSWEAS